MELYYNKADEIDGWFNYKIIVPILELINKEQENGNILEIGLFKGKSFIPLIFLLKNNEKAYGIDVFENQQFNYDNSGEGNYDIFISNIKKLFNENIFNKIKIIKEDSTKLDKTHYLKYSNNSKYRIISIDGCHTKDATLIDLKNAIDILTDDGIIIIDDYFNNDWPGVKFGVDIYLSNDNSFRVIYIGANKLILCRRNMYDKYIQILKKTDTNFAKNYEKRCWIAGVWKK